MSVAVDMFLLGLVPTVTATLSLGPQNTLVLRHGLARERALLVVGVCLGCDVGLIVGATLGVCTVIVGDPLATSLLTWVGILYLAFCAFRMLRSACAGAEPPSLGHSRSSPFATLFHAFGVSLLNPLVWVETVAVLTALASTVRPEFLPYFGLGAATGSVIKFSLLSLVARRLAFVFIRRPLRRGFDAMSGAVMLTMSLLLASSVV